MEKEKLYPYSGLLFSHKRNEILIHSTTWMKLEKIMLSKRSQAQKATCCVPRTAFIRDNQKKQVHQDRKQISSSQGLGLGRMGAEC